MTKSHLDIFAETYTPYKIACDGENTHPKIYLKTDEKKSSAICPYCNRVFYKEIENVNN